MLEYDEEIIDRYVGILYNLKTLLRIKEELGDSVDITDRYIGWCPCCDSEETFLRSSISIILDLNYQQESVIRVEYHTLEDFVKTYPDIRNNEIQDEVTEIVFPSVYADICELVYEALPEKIFTYGKIDNETSHIYFITYEWPEFQDIVDFFIEVRKAALKEGK